MAGLKARIRLLRLRYGFRLGLPILVGIGAGVVAIAQRGPATGETGEGANHPRSDGPATELGDLVSPSGSRHLDGGAPAGTPGDPTGPPGEEPVESRAAPLIAPTPVVGANRFPAVRAPVVPKPAAVRGIYLNAFAAGSERRRAELIALASRTELNSFVIDVKEAGEVSYRTGIALARAIGAERNHIPDPRRMLAELRAAGIYPIARIVVFKDPVLARQRPGWAIQDSSGGLWRDQQGAHWVDPYNREVWDYNIALAREAILLGFSEIQWDYVRFPDVPTRLMRNAVFPARAGRSRTEAIREFLQYSRDKLADLGVQITADVFGLTVSVQNDMGIGQRWEDLSDVTDALLPMIYPSHFAKGSYGIPIPNADPYRTVKIALGFAVRRSARIEGAAAIRPWLQDFSLGWPDYGPAEVRAQIQATYDAGLTEWILWNPGSRYTAGALASATGEAPLLAIPRHLPPTVADSLHREIPDSAREVRVLGRPVERGAAGRRPGGGSR